MGMFEGGGPRRFAEPEQWMADDIEDAEPPAAAPCLRADLRPRAGAVPRPPLPRGPPVSGGLPPSRRFTPWRLSRI